MKDSDSKIKVAIIAMAKDEAPYFHEWIHHHFYFGFDSIYIGINRTTDKSIDILSKIAKKINNIYYESLDWLDQGTRSINPCIQGLGYAYFANKIIKNSLATHVLFIDIDEFWFSHNGSSINDFIEDNNYFDIASFQWLCQLGEEKEFTPPFVDTCVAPNNHVKSLININSFNRIIHFSCHVPIYQSYKIYSELSHIDNYGNKINSDCVDGFNNQFPLKNISLDLNYGILHRMIRSESEYLSLVMRGNLNGDKIKSNGRNGFKFAQINYNFNFPEAYYDSLCEFISLCEIENELAFIRNDALVLWKKKIELLTELELVNEFKRAFTALNGTRGLDLFVECFIDKVESADACRDFATLIESQNLSHAFKLMSKAKKIRPSGPVINKKLEEYRILLTGK